MLFHICFAFGNIRQGELMKITEIIREIMQSKNISVSAMAKTLKENGRVNSSPRLVCERLGQSNISIDKAVELLNPLGYKIQVVPESTRTPNDGYEVEMKL
jgi:biotin operon repressor